MSRTKTRTTTGAASRRVRFGGKWLIPYDDATSEIEIERTLADVLKATPGSDTLCMNSLCILAQRTKHVFPHPVYVVSTTQTRVFIVDQLDDSGNPAHCVRYQLDERESRLIHDHDTLGVGEPGLLRLRIPKDPKGSPVRKASAERAAYEGRSGGRRFGDGGARHSGDGRFTGRNTRPVTARGPAGRVVAALGGVTGGT